MAKAAAEVVVRRSDLTMGPDSAITKHNHYNISSFEKTLTVILNKFTLANYRRYKQKDIISFFFF